MSEKEKKEVLELFHNASEDIKRRALQILRESKQLSESPDQQIQKAP